MAAEPQVYDPKVLTLEVRVLSVVLKIEVVETDRRPVPLGRHGKRRSERSRRAGCPAPDPFVSVAQQV